jgi:hypothetical protein
MIRRKPISGRERRRRQRQSVEADYQRFAATHPCSDEQMSREQWYFHRRYIRIQVGRVK